MVGKYVERPNVQLPCPGRTRCAILRPMLSEPRGVTLCIVNYEGARHLPRALSAAPAGSFDEILVVDNASTDGGLAWLSLARPDVHVLALDRNRGPAGARNCRLRRPHV